jgi:hypothetical protein
MLPLSVSINGFDQYILPQYYSIILVKTMGDSANQAKTKCSHLLQKESWDSGLHSSLSKCPNSFLQCTDACLGARNFQRQGSVFSRL